MTDNTNNKINNGITRKKDNTTTTPAFYSNATIAIWLNTNHTYSPALAPVMMQLKHTNHIKPMLLGIL